MRVNNERRSTHSGRSHHAHVLPEAREEQVSGVCAVWQARYAGVDCIRREVRHLDAQLGERLAEVGANLLLEVVDRLSEVGPE